MFAFKLTKKFVELTCREAVGNYAQHLTKLLCAAIRGPEAVNRSYEAQFCPMKSSIR
jgi:hypothetical protein